MSQRNATEDLVHFQASLLDAVQQAVIATDPEGRVTYWNRHAEDLYGWRAEEAIGRNILELTPSNQSREQAIEIMDRLNRGQRWSGEFLVRRRDGSTFPALVTDAPIRNEKGQLIGVVGLTTDLRQLKEIEASRRASEAQMAALYRSNVIGMFVATGEIITEANDTFLKLVGYTREDLEAGRINWAAMTPPEYADADQQALAELAQRGACTQFEKEYVRKDGQHVPILIGASVLEGEPARWACFALDLSGRRELERQREELLASISHDLRQPLALIKGRSQLLRRRIRRGQTPSPEQLADALAAVEASVDDIEVELGELMDTTRLQLGQPLELQLVQTDLVVLARHVVDDWEHASPIHTVRLVVGVEGLQALVDAGRLRRVLNNLMSNALKYSPSGGEITLTVGQEAQSGSRCGVFEVRDQGLGIAQDDLPHVFERYYRAPNALGVATGTGLGLSGAQQIVRQHGGTIDVSSVHGEGSTFTVRLPLQPRP